MRRIQTSASVPLWAHRCAGTLSVAIGTPAVAPKKTGTSEAEDVNPRERPLKVPLSRKALEMVAAMCRTESDPALGLRFPLCQHRVSADPRGARRFPASAVGTGATRMQPKSLFRPLKLALFHQRCYQRWAEAR